MDIYINRPLETVDLNDKEVLRMKRDKEYLDSIRTSPYSTELKGIFEHSVSVTNEMFFSIQKEITRFLLS